MAWEHGACGRRVFGQEIFGQGWFGGCGFFDPGPPLARRRSENFGAGGWWAAQMIGERNAEHVAEGAQDAAKLGGLGDEGGHIRLGEQELELRAGAGDEVTGEETRQPGVAGRQLEGAGIGEWFGCAGAAVRALGAGFGGIGRDLAEAADEIADAFPDEDIEGGIDAQRRALIADDFAQERQDHGEAIRQGQRERVSYRGHALIWHGGGGVGKREIFAESQF